MVAHKSTDCVGCNVSEALMEGENVNSFDWVGVSCIGMFNPEQTMFVSRDASNLRACWINDLASS